MEIKRKIAIFLSLLFVISYATPVYAMYISEYFHKPGRGTVADYQERLMEILYEIEVLNKYIEKPKGEILFITGEIMGSSLSDEITVIGSAPGSKITTFMIKYPDHKNFIGGGKYSGSNELILNQWATPEHTIGQVGPVDRSVYTDQINILKQEGKRLQEEIKKPKEATDKQPPAELWVENEKYYVLDNTNTIPNGIEIATFDNSDCNYDYSYVGVIEWQGAYFMGEIENKIPNGEGLMFEKFPDIEQYTSMKISDLGAWNYGLWVDGKYSRLNKYESERKSTILFELNSPGMLAYEGLTLIEDGNIWARTLSKNGHTMIPIRSLIETVGGEVKYDDVSKTVDINFEEKTVKLTLDDTIASVNGKPTVMPIAAQIINGKTMIPLRFISESLGMKVDWDAKEKIVIITYPEGY